VAKHGAPREKPTNAKHTTPPPENPYERGTPEVKIIRKKNRPQRINHRKQNEMTQHHRKAAEAESIGDTTETLDEATLEEMRELVQRIEADDLPPTKILLIHHVERPRKITQDPSATVILKYMPSTNQPIDERHQEAIDAFRAEEKERPCEE
jgi:hypothetical protein